MKKEVDTDSTKLSRAYPILTTKQMIEVDRLMIEEYSIELKQMMENDGRGPAWGAKCWEATLAASGCWSIAAWATTVAVAWWRAATCTTGERK